MQNDIIPGFFGKLPSTGDFVSRRLPSDFVKPWDKWLQESLYDIKKELGQNFRNRFLAAPVWRFILAPGSCGRHGAAGILAPSFDRVGRCFPLTIAIIADGSLSHLLLRASQWFSQLELLVGLLRNERLDFKKFDAQLQRQTLPQILFKNKKYTESGLLAPKNDPLFFRLDMDSVYKLPNAVECLFSHLLNCNLNRYSLWHSNRVEKRNSSLLVFRGLPPTDRYMQFL